jgi:hypothetical protein
MKEGEQISIKPLQDKGNPGEILKTMKGAQGLSRISRSGEQKKMLPSLKHTVR